MGSRSERLAAGAITAIVALALVRVGVLAVAHRTVIFMPDLWETLLGAQSAAHGDQAVGAWSRLGLYHPGPAWFAWAGPFVTVTDAHPSGLVLAATALAATAVVVTVSAITTSSTPVGALTAATVVALGVGQLSTDGLAVPWNPTVVIVPVTAAIACIAATAVRGSTWTAVAAVAFGSLIAQAHLGTLVLGGLLIVGAVGAWSWRWVGSGEPLPRRRAAAIALALVLPWVPVAVDQVAGVGNAGAVARYVVTGSVDERFPSEPTGPSAELSVPEVLRHLGSIASLVQGRTALWAGAEVPAGQVHEPSTTSTVVVLALVGAAAAVARPSRWRRSPIDQPGIEVWICRVGLAALALQAAAALAVRGQFRPYLVVAAAGVGLALWIGVAMAAAHAAVDPVRRVVPAPRRRAARIAGASTLAIVALLAIATYSGSTRGYQLDVQQQRAAEDRLLTELAGRRVEVRVEGEDALASALVLTARLEARDTRVGVHGRFRAHFSDRQRNLRIDDLPRLHLYVHPSAAPDGCAELGRYLAARFCLAD